MDKQNETKNNLDNLWLVSLIVNWDARAEIWTHYHSYNYYLFIKENWKHERILSVVISGEQFAKYYT